MHLTAKFHRPTFNRLEVIMLINKQTPLKTSTSLRCATPVGNGNLFWRENIRQMEQRQGADS